MNKTQYIDSNKIDDKSFYIDVLYHSYTSYSKSLEPTCTRLFKKYAQEYMNGGQFKLEIQNIEVACKIDGLHAIAPYSIRRIIYTLK